MRAKGGFLLLEVIVSIVVITTGILLVMRAYGASKHAIERSRELFTTGLLLDEKAFDIEEPGAIAEGSSEKVFEDHREYRWSLAASSRSPDDPNIEVVTLDVSPSNTATTLSNTSSGYALVTYLLKEQG